VKDVFNKKTFSKNRIQGLNMSSLQSRVLALVAWLLVFFSVERVEIGTFQGINLATAVYIIGMVAVLLPLIPGAMLIPLPMMTGMIGVLYLISLLIGRGPVVEGAYVYLVLAGAFFLLVTLLLSYLVGQSLEEFRRAVETITFSARAGRLRSRDEASELGELEMTRSRRSERPISIMLLQADASSLNMAMHRMVQDIQRAMMQRYVLATAANVLSRHLRRSDVIFEDGAAGRLVLLAPETGEAEATRMSARIAMVVQEQLGIQVRSSVAAFPDQALTFDDLLRVAEQRLHTAPTVEHMPPSEPEPPRGIDVESEVLHA